MPYLDSIAQPIISSQEDTVGTPSLGYLRMMPAWMLVEDLLGGTRRMREVGQRWLPRETLEQPDKYYNRLQRSFLYEAMKDTIDKIAAKPFTQPMSVSDKEALPKELQPILKNADRIGSSLEQISKALFKDGVTWGKCHILVDYPSVGSNLSLAEEKNLGVYPYFVAISPKDLIGWESRKTESSQDILTKIRIRECRIVKDGKFKEKEVVYIRVITETTWELFEEVKPQQEYRSVANGINTLGKVPMITVQFEETEFMCAKPPLEGLAWLNIAHWQSFSDQRNLLRFARTGILFMKGVTAEERDKGVTLAPNALFSSVNKDADMKHVEHTGQSVSAGEVDLEKLEQRMEILGLQPLMEGSGGGQNTATGRVADEAKTQSRAQNWVSDLAHGMRLAFELAAEWIGVKLSDKFGIKFFTEFNISMKAGLDVQSLVTSVQTNNISRMTFIDEMKRRGVISENVDTKEELARILEDIKTNPANQTTDNPTNATRGLPTKSSPVSNKVTNA